MNRIALAATLALSGCMSVDKGGHPTVELAPGYVATICETSVGLTGNGRMYGVGGTVKWGCAEVKKESAPINGRGTR